MAHATGNVENIKIDHQQRVDPRSVQGRLLHVEIKDGSILIHEYTNTHKCYFRHSTDFERYDIKWHGTQQVSISSPYDNSNWHSPICIACHGNLYVIQFIDPNQKNMSFALINVDDNSVYYISSYPEVCSPEPYFKASYANTNPVDCLIDPGLTKILFRLPQYVLKTNEWSKMFSVDLLEGQSYSTSPMVQGGLKDKHNQSLAFDPRYPSRLLYVLCDPDCRFFKLTVYDLTSSKIVKRKRVQYMSNRPNKVYSASDADDTSDENEPAPAYEVETLSLAQFGMAFCRSGDFFVICAEVNCDSWTSQKRYYLISVITIDSDTLEVISTSTEDVTYNMGHPDGSAHLYRPIFCPCDGHFSVALLEDWNQIHLVLSDVILPKETKLLDICRKCILRHCSVSDLDRLDVPKYLMDLLTFGVKQNPCHNPLSNSGQPGLPKMMDELKCSE